MDADVGLGYDAWKATNRLVVKSLMVHAVELPLLSRELVAYFYSQ